MNDPSVSRKHAKLFKDQGAIWIQDLDSANGTVVNGLAIKPNHPAKLPIQGEVAFGAVELTIAMY
jgi:pSer/pThr/pTyr-binding forkhead associated (FHA) protein